MDVLTPEQRRKNMSNIRSKDTKPELVLRKLLWSKGIRYRIKNNFPGRPDIFFKNLKLAIFVDGCFWHGCPKHYSEPKTNTPFWREKINGNKSRDKKVNATLKESGWRILRFWEHDLKKRPHWVAEKIQQKLQELKI